ncbi:MAG: hypothetical protein WBO17_06270 [Sphingorhabdus sp.]
MLTFPGNWQRRMIEVWGVILFDVAPWGGTGNLRIVASEPATEFGKMARRIVQAAKLAPSTSGLSGCVEIVRSA